jgi:thiamine pyrophosphate-dependent acetolactate synthase large subunit-like protein
VAAGREPGGHGVQVIDAVDLDKAIADALAYEGPAIVEIHYDPELI